MIIAKKFSLRPNKLVLYNEVSRSCSYKELETIQRISNEISVKKTEIVEVKKVIKKKFHNFKISINAQRKLKEKIDWLYYLSKSRYKQTYTKKHIYNYKLSFITLTLPSKQLHTTSDITKNLYNQFLTEVRQRTKMNNYVWRLEFQKNGNVHYHLVTDSYLDYWFCLKIWNRVVEKYGYVAAYQKRMNRYSLADYFRIYGKNKSENFEKCKKRYEKGKKENWSNPNSVDVKSVSNGKNIANYISKYFGKNSQDDNICNELDNEDNSYSLRLWFCSRSLSKLVSVSDYIDNFSQKVEYCLEKCADMKYVSHKYVTVIYYKFKKNSNRFKRMINWLLRNYAKELGYAPSS